MCVLFLCFRWWFVGDFVIDLLKVFSISCWWFLLVFNYLLMIWVCVCLKISRCVVYDFRTICLMIVGCLFDDFVFCFSEFGVFLLMICCRFCYYCLCCCWWCVDVFWRYLMILMVCVDDFWKMRLMSLVCCLMIWGCLFYDFEVFFKCVVDDCFDDLGVFVWWFCGMFLMILGCLF